MTPAGSAWSSPTVPVPAVPLPPAAPSGVPLPSSQRRTARLISADAAQSTLKLAADGKLPELQLEEDKEKKKVAEEEGSSMNPLVLFGALTLSVAMSIGMVLMDSSAPKADGGLERTKAREMIETDYFGGGPLERGKQLLPYQEMLRDAHREHLRGNYRAERKLYQKVLNLLRAERGRNDSGLTGSTLRDRILENQLLILLSEG
jgi:hypothetical protein